MNLSILILNLFSCTYTSVMLSLMGKPLKGNVLKYSATALILYIIIITSNYLFPAFMHSTYEPYVILVGVIISYMIIFKENLFYTLFYMLFGFILVMFIQTLMLPIFYVFGITLELALQNPWTTAFVEILCFAVIITLSWFNVFKKHRQLLSKLVPYFLSFALNMFLFMQLGRLLTNWIVNGETINYVYFYSLFFALIFFNVYLIWYVIKTQSELDQKKSYSEYEKMIIPLIENSCATEHDFKNHLLTLQSLAKGNNEEINEYIEGVNSEIKNQSVYKLCNNPVMGALLQEKHEYARERDIDFDIEIYESDRPAENIKPHHLITVLSNLIDNAIEESQKSKDKKIKLHYTQNETINISVTNSLADKQNIGEMKSNSRYSTKGSSRGYGLNNIKKIAKQYSGDVGIYHLGETIEIKVSLNP